MTEQPTTRVLSQHIMLACYDTCGRTVDVPTTMSYRHTDPYAVTLTFHSDAGDVEWVVGRPLLRQGLSSPCGDGDVRMYPSIDTDDRPIAVLDFRSPDGRLITEAPHDELQGFLTRTFAVVPAGTESDHLDMDALIEELLHSAE
jgi:hypothetical protein